MAKREKTEYQLKVEELKAIIKTMQFGDVVKLRKNADTIIAGVLKSKVSARRNEINKEFDKQKQQHEKELDKQKQQHEKKLEELAKLENEIGLK